MSKSMSWEWREHNREKVEKALQKGEYDAILTSRESALATLAHLAWELGVLDAVKQIRVRRQRAGIPDELLLRTLAVLPFVEAVGLSAAAETLFADAAVLIQLGYTALQVQMHLLPQPGKPCGPSRTIRSQPHGLLSPS